MAAVDDPKTFGRARLSFANTTDIDEFVDVLSRFEKGEATPEEWRAFRLLRGTYGQRQTDDAQMLRVKIPQGILTADQLDALADIADNYSRRFGHLTTRQNMQFHFVKLHDAEKAMRRAAEAGLTTREACGNSVRNVTECPYAGVAHDEPFHTSPYSEALIRFFLGHPLASSLPRKFKIAFEGCTEDHANASVNDLGWRAAVKDGVKGFRLHVAGGTAILCRSGQVFFDFLPAEEMLNAAEAVLRIFHQHGDRQHRQRNRMKFLVQQLGFDTWRAKVMEAYEEIRKNGGHKLPFDAQNPPTEEAPTFARLPPPSPQEVADQVKAVIAKGPGVLPTPEPKLNLAASGFAKWAKSNVRRQRQAGYSIVTTTVVLGDLTSAQMRVLGRLARSFGDGLVRTTPEQNLVFRWVSDAEVPMLFQLLSAAGLGLGDAGSAADVTSCPGAESCKLAVTQSRGLGSLITEALRARPDLIELAPELKIKASGCPNGCGLHHVAGIGFQGSVRKVGAKVVPQYFVLLGGHVGPTSARFGRIAAKIPARRIPDAVTRLLELYRAERNADETSTDFFARVTLAKVKALVADLELMTPETAKPEDFIDLGERTEFKPETSEGECAA